MLLKIVIALNSSGVAEITCYEGLTILIESSYTWSFLLKVLIHEKDPFEGSYTWRFLWKLWRFLYMKVFMKILIKVLIHEGFFMKILIKVLIKNPYTWKVLITWKKILMKVFLESYGSYEYPYSIWRFLYIKVFMKVYEGSYTWRSLWKSL